MSNEDMATHLSVKRGGESTDGWPEIVLESSFPGGAWKIFYTSGMESESLGELAWKYEEDSNYGTIYLVVSSCVPEHDMTDLVYGLTGQGQ